MKLKTHKTNTAGEIEALTIEQAKALAKNTLGAKRYAHEKNVVDVAVRLAQRYGASTEKAALAGWLHDIMKEAGPEEMLRQLRQDDIIAKSTQKRPLPVWHGPAAQVYAKHSLGVQDEEVLQAIGCHTTGKPGMGKLDKIVFVADMISAERDFEGVEELRRLAFEDLDVAVLAALRRSIGYLKKRGFPLDGESERALRELEQQAAQSEQPPTPTEVLL